MVAKEKSDKLLASITLFMRILSKASHRDMKRTMNTLAERSTSIEYDDVQRTIWARLGELIRMQIVQPSVFKKPGD